MIGLGLGILWIGYTGFATGRAYAKGIPVTFSDMVLPKYRSATISLLKQGGAGGNTSGAGKPPDIATKIGGTGLLGLSGGLAGPIESGDKGIVNGVTGVLKGIGNAIGSAFGL